MGLKKTWQDKRKRVGLSCPEPSMAVQEQEAEANINNIVRNFGVTGKLPQAIRLPQFGDFDGVNDYQTALEAISQAEEAFSRVPSELRVKLGHDPQKFLEWCADKENREEMIRLGLIDQPAGQPAPPPPTSEA